MSYYEYMYFAHAEEVHQSLMSSIDHWLKSDLNALAVWLIVVAGTFVIARAAKLSLPAQLLALGAGHLVYGVLLYRSSPAIGALVISVGFMLAGAIAFISLQMEGQKNGK